MSNEQNFIFNFVCFQNNVQSFEHYLKLHLQYILNSLWLVNNNNTNLNNVQNFEHYFGVSLHSHSFHPTLQYKN